jgi:chromate reductase
VQILGIAGSLRRDSWNRKLLLAAGELLPEEAELVVWDGLKAVPPYDEDDDVEPVPAAVAELRDAIKGADAVLFVTPEYNGSLPGQLKNAVDWASRPRDEAALQNKPVAVLGASTGAFGAVWAQGELAKVLSRAGARVVNQGIPLAHAPEQFGLDGRLLDPNLRGRIEELLESLVQEAAARAELAAAA